MSFGGGPAVFVRLRSPTTIITIHEPHSFFASCRHPLANPIIKHPGADINGNESGPKEKVADIDSVQQRETQPPTQETLQSDISGDERGRKEKAVDKDLTQGGILDIVHDLRRVLEDTVDCNCPPRKPSWRMPKHSTAI